MRPTDRWKLEIAGYGYVRLVNEPSLFNTPTPTVTPSSTRPPAPDPTTTAIEPVLDPVAHSSELGSGDGLVIGGLACLLVGSALGLTQRSVSAAGRRSSVRPS